MTQHGTLGEFVNGKEEWKSYTKSSNYTLLPMISMMYLR